RLRLSPHEDRVLKSVAAARGKIQHSCGTSAFTPRASKIPVVWNIDRFENGPFQFPLSPRTYSATHECARLQLHPQARVAMLKWRCAGKPIIAVHSVTAIAVSENPAD